MLNLQPKAINLQEANKPYVLIKPKFGKPADQKHP